LNGKDKQLESLKKCIKPSLNATALQCARTAAGEAGPAAVQAFLVVRCGVDQVQAGRTRATPEKLGDMGAGFAGMLRGRLPCSFF
jgi:hypothetical protein